RGRGFGQRQLGGAQDQGVGVRQAIHGRGGGALVGGGARAGQGRTAGHVDADRVGGLQQRQRQERRDRRAIDAGEAAGDAALGRQDLVGLAQHVVVARQVAGHQGAAVEGGGAGDAQQVGLVRRQQFGDET